MEHEYKIGQQIEIVVEGKTIPATVLDVSIGEGKRKMELLAHCANGDLVLTVVRELVN